MRISRTVTGLIAVALLAFMVSDALGQGEGRRGQGGRGPGGPGGRGPGGPGGGQRGGFGQRGGGFGQFGDPLLGLLRVDEVKVEIELMPDQEEAVKKLTERGNQRPERPDFDFRNATEEERNEFFGKMRKQQEERTKKMREQLEEVLLPQQYDRLKQIALQQQGVRALYSPEVAAELKITDAQKKEFEKAQQDMRSKMQGLFGQGNRGGDPNAARDTMRKAMEESSKATLAVLTSSQTKQFDEMKGEKFEMPESAQSGFGGRGGPGGRRGPGGAGRGGRGGRPARPEVEE